MNALYRTHRPQNWDALVGQNIVSTTLQNEVISGRIAHAYLFSGPRGVGKTTTARLMAKSINCTGRAPDSAEPDGTCAACTAIQACSVVDIIELDGATNTGVEMVRDNIIENAVVRPMQLTYKIFIIDEVHRLSPQAFDALLKTLEEPPSRVVFILATTEAHKVPATVLSRVQRFTFTLIAPNIIHDRLQKLCQAEKATVAQEVIDMIIARSGGSMRDAESMLDQLLSLGTKIGLTEAALVLPASVTADAYPFVAALFASAAQALMILQSADASGIPAEALNRAAMEVLRAVLVNRLAPSITFPYLEGWQNHQESLALASASCTVAQLRMALGSFITAHEAGRHCSIPFLPLELAVADCAEIFGITDKHSGADGVDGTAEPHNTAQTAAPHKTDDERGSEKASVPPEKSNAETNVNETRDFTAPQWQTLCKEVGKTNPSLCSILNNAKPLGVSGDTFSLAVPFHFHKDHLNHQAHRSLIENHLHAITGSALNLVCVVHEAPEGETEENKDAAPDETDETANETAKEIAAAFDGAIVPTAKHE